MIRNKILLVDDHVIILESLKSILVKNYNVQTCQSATEALVSIDKEPPDLIISNIHMPGPNGFEFLEALQQKNHTRAIPFIFLTMFAERAYRERALLNGADDYIVKDQSVNYLIKRIDHLLQRVEYFRRGSISKPPAQELKVFISYAREDESIALKIWKMLSENGVSAWIDLKNILPGQEWENEIKKALKSCHVVITCLSSKSVSKRGYVQKELKIALDLSELEPQDGVFIIPIILEECQVPEKLKKWHWLNFFEENSKAMLINSLKLRAETLGVLPPRGPIEQISDDKNST